MSGIPGSAGATPVQNVGAYGAEVADTITRVRLLDRAQRGVRWAPAGELGFGYRTSVLKHSDAGHRFGGGVRAGRLGPQCAAALRRVGDRAGRRPRRARRSRGGARGGAHAARPQGHGARPGRPRHLERGIVLHQSRRRARGLRGARRSVAGRPVPHYPAPDGVKLAAGWLVEQAGFGKGYPADRGRALPAFHQACACFDQPRRRRRRRRAVVWRAPCATASEMCLASH